MQIAKSMDWTTWKLNRIFSKLGALSKFAEKSDFLKKKYTVVLNPSKGTNLQQSAAVMLRNCDGSRAAAVLPRALQPVKYTEPRNCTEHCGIGHAAQNSMPRLANSMLCLVTALLGVPSLLI